VNEKKWLLESNWSTFFMKIANDAESASNSFISVERNWYTLDSLNLAPDWGNVWIGTTSPWSKLDVNSWWNNTVANFESTDAWAAILLQDNSTTAAEAMQRIWNDIRMLRSWWNFGIWVIPWASKFAIGWLPTSASGLSSWDVWRDGTDLKIVA
jgi:hypothetical protein